MTHFFPNIDPRRAGDLAVSDHHVLYWEQCGSVDGTPLLFLHGGPGSGSSAKYRRLFDPREFNITLFDQRGAGRSTPHLSLIGNTTGDLIDDIEALRHKLGIDKWIVFGPSWGSTLAIAYAEAFPEHVLALVVEAVFLGTKTELDWWHSPSGAPRFFPEAWSDFITPVPEKHRKSARSVLDWCFEDMLREQSEKFIDLNHLTDPKITLPELRKSTLYRWTEFEERLSYLEKTDEDARTGLAERGPAFVAAHSLIEAHYFKNDCFFKPDQLIAHARQLANIPMRIIHSRYDMVCPPQSAHRLADACPHAELHMVTLSGHGMTDPVQMVLNSVMDELITKLKG
jgi:proline iminopeptidase